MFFLIAGIDIVGPLYECQGMKYIVTSVCYFTKWVEARAIPNKTGAEVAHFIYWLFTRYRMHGSLHLRSR